MSTRLIYKLGFLVSFFSFSLFLCCTTQTKEVVVQKIVKDKKEAVSTDYEHVFSAWKGDFVLQPKIKTTYYLIYSDGGFEEVSLGKYANTNIGDTIPKITYKVMD